MGDEEMNVLEAVERLQELHRDVDWYDAILRRMHQQGISRFAGSLDPHVADALAPVESRRGEATAPEGAEPVEEAWWEEPYSDLDSALETVFEARS